VFNFLGFVSFGDLGHYKNWKDWESAAQAAAFKPENKSPQADGDCGLAMK
jgi:hypothetical protein